jgi:hypothetical protein
MSSLSEKNVNFKINFVLCFIFSYGVGPACLPYTFNQADLTGYYLTAVGWVIEVLGNMKAIFISEF